MRLFSNISNIGLLAAGMLSALLLAPGCGGGGKDGFDLGGGGGGGGDTTPPRILTIDPIDGSTAVPLNKGVSVTFTEPINAATINTSSFTLTPTSGVAVPATLTYASNVAVLQPTTALAPLTRYTGRLGTAIKDVAGNPLAANYTWSFTTGVSADTTAPTLISTDPADGAAAVSLNKAVAVTFSEPMNATTVNSSTFTVSPPSGVAVAATIGYAGNVAVLQPTSALAPSTIYSGKVTTGAKDLAGNAISGTVIWTFKTGVAGDATAPVVQLTDPASAATGVTTNKAISVTFSEPMNATTLNTGSFMLTAAGGPAVPASISYAGNIAILQPASVLASSTVYTGTVTTGAKDLAGNALASNYTWTFTTGSAGDVTPPTVVSTNPTDGWTNAFLNQSVSATFSEPMQAATLNILNFTVNGVIGTVTYDAATMIAKFTPAALLSPNTTYTATITQGVKDSSGNALATAKIWTFTTGNQQSQGGINFGAASTYAVLAGSTVTNAGPTVLNGDLGVFPGTAITGFPPGLVNGGTHGGDATAAQAKADLLTAQNDAAGRLGAVTLPGDLSGLTFTPGLYKNSTSVMLSAGSMTLDARGDSTAVFIFQMGSTLTTSPGTQVILAGGAKASNIYWSVGTSATLGVNSIFKGVILSEVSITVNTGAVVDGTLLTKTGAVTLASNTVTRG